MSANEAHESKARLGQPTVAEYCRSQGFPFEPELIARYLAALLTKPFVILAGVSGTGKSKLAEFVADLSAPLGEWEDKQAMKHPSAIPSFSYHPEVPHLNRFALVAVRPDWVDNQSVLGFVNPITELYESTQALDLMLRASRAVDVTTDKPAAPRYFMLLDEMNLARVEHYFSDWLACAESRRYREAGLVIQQPVPLHRADKHMETMLRRVDGTTETVEVPPLLPLPTNLVVHGHS